MLDFKHLSAIGVTEIAESTHLKGCPHTFVNMVYHSPSKYIFLSKVDISKVRANKVERKASASV